MWQHASVLWFGFFFSSVFSCKTNVKHCFRFRPRCCSICSLSLYLCQIFDYHTMSLTMTLHTRASARALTTVLRNECLEVHPNASWLGVTSGATSPRCQCLIPSSWNIHHRQVYADRKCISGCLGLRGWRQDSRSFCGTTWMPVTYLRLWTCFAHLPSPRDGVILTKAAFPVWLSSKQCYPPPILTPPPSCPEYKLNENRFVFNWCSLWI